ncbi:uncharacterized protein G2W53_021865 [Senna tora]|uniref:Uncharacterized protein n=1 Tax=Senna tora TaxID=362788 RepID=A0A834TMN9_9FABA|nr:uncharacterized protein G2W53_021865 [Senna tora]
MAIEVNISRKMVEQKRKSSEKAERATERVEVNQSGKEAREITTPSHPDNPGENHDYGPD